MDQAPYYWTCVTEKADFAPRDGAGALVFNNRMWLIGGWNPSDRAHFPCICNNEVWSSADGRAWRLEKPNSHLRRDFDSSTDWEGRHTAGYAVFRGRMWIVGGDLNQGHHQHDVWSSTDGRCWVRECAAVAWAPRVLHCTTAFAGRLWVMGGQSQCGKGPGRSGPTHFYHDAWSSTDGRHWERVCAAAPWAPRGMIGGQAVFKGRIWLLGGGTYDTPDVPRRTFYNDVWSSADGVHWEPCLEQAPWPPRQYHDVAVFDGKLWILEGGAWDPENPPRAPADWPKVNRNDVWYSEDGIHWTELPDTPWAPRHAASVFVFDNALWMVAGNNMKSDVWKLVRTR